MSNERDRYLTEQMGECWHEFGDEGCYCTKCSSYKVRPKNTDYASWNGFGKLWEWAQNQTWLCNFIFTVPGSVHDTFLEHIKSPDRFANAVYSYLKERDK